MTNNALLIETCNLENEFPSSTIPLPFNDTYLQDIYSVGPSDSDRWRCFINVENWDPRQFHDTLLRRKAYHARVLWEWEDNLAWRQKSDLTTTSMYQLRDMALLELCTVDIEIASYQLTCGMLGFDKDHEKLWETAITLYKSMIFLTQNLGKVENLKKFKKTLLELKLMVPTKSYSSKELARAIDGTLMGLKTILSKGEITVETLDKKDNLIWTISQMLKKCIISLDSVLQIVIDNNKNTLI